MKYKIVVLVFLISIKMNCQLLNVGNFYSEKWNKENGDKNITIYKIKGKKYQSDHNTYFSSDKEIIYKYITNDIIRFMIYDKRYLFIGYFPNTKENTMRAVPPEVWALDKLDIIDLEDLKKKWTYQFNKKTSMRNIKSFNPKDGDIVYCNHVKPEKNTTE